MARVIVLNGVSSAGKSSLAKAMQLHSDSDWLHVSLDQFISMIPAEREMKPDWFVVQAFGDDGSPEVSLTNGPNGSQLMAAMRDFIRSAADRGLDIIVDDVCTQQEITDYRALLASHELAIVKVEVPLAVAEHRERSRGDRMIGLARNQWGRIHEGIAYDLVVENGDGALEACAETILSS